MAAIANTALMIATTTSTPANNSVEIALGSSRGLSDMVPIPRPGDCCAR
jgi:hypothetical protein